MNVASFVAQARDVQPLQDPTVQLRVVLERRLNQLAALVLLLLLSPVLLVVSFLIWQRDGAPIF
jgi:undecaprenyl-phosphate galactose phosphotransferase